MNKLEKRLYLEGGMHFNRFTGWKKEFLLAGLLLLASDLFPQRLKTDSLQKLIPGASDSSRVVIYNELSWIYKNIDVDSATLYARKARAIAARTGNKKLVAAALNSLGSAKQAAGEYDSALVYLNQSIREKITGADSSSISSELSNIGIIYDEKGDYDKALQSYFTGLRLAKRAGNTRLEANLLSNIGVVYKKQKQYLKVLEYYNTALDLYKKLGSAFGITVTSGNIGSVLLQTGQYEESIDYSLIAKKGYEALGYVRYVPYTIGNLAIAYDSLHQNSIAEDYYKEAYEEHLEFGNIYEAAYNSKNLAFFYLKHHQIAKAKEFALKAVALAQKIGAKEMLRDSYQVMAWINRELGQFKDAYDYELKFIELKDSLSEERKTKTILELQVKYETESRELLLATNALELEQRNNQVLWLSAVSALLLISGLFVYQYQKAKRRKLRQEVQFQLKLAEVKLENELHQDRLRISRDLHDNIGSRLLFLYTNAETLAEKSPPGENEKAYQLSSFAKSTLHELRRTVWFINKDFVRLEELQLKLNEYFGFLNQSATSTVNLVLRGDPSLTIRSTVGAAIFRVAQEAVSNAIKHATATEIEIDLNSTGDKILQLQISDNGKGFSAGDDRGPSREGNGLKNMQAHADNARGKLEITSGENRGTRVILTLPLE